MQDRRIGRHVQGVAKIQRENKFVQKIIWKDRWMEKKGCHYLRRDYNSKSQEKKKARQARKLQEMDQRRVIEERKSYMKFVEKNYSIFGYIPESKDPKFLGL